MNLEKLKTEIPFKWRVQSANQWGEGELYLRGIDEYGKDFQVCFDAYNFLDWIDTEQVKYIKEQVIKHIQDK